MTQHQRRLANTAWEHIALSANDFEAFREVISGWDTEPVQLTGGRLGLRYREFSRSGNRYGLLETRPVIADRNAIHSPGLKFVVPFAPLKTAGREVMPGQLMIYRNGREYRSVLSRGFRSLEIALTPRRARAIGLDALISEPQGGPDADIHALPPRVFAGLAAVAGELLAALSDAGSEEERGVIADMIEVRTDGLLAEGLGGNGHDASAAPRVPRYDLAVAALAEIEASSETGRASLAEIATDLGVSSRAVEQAFKSAYGVSPRRYSLALRLEATRRALSVPAARPINVSRAALENGFGNLGRFSAQYRRQFGERPSDTLRAARTAPRGRHREALNRAHAG